jgi:periplasmic divalent cation tolerance protein
MSDALVVLVTAPNDEQARLIARKLLEEKLAACINFVPIQSMYVWEGAIQENAEVLLIIKTRQTAFHDLLAAVKAVHPYDVPEIISLPVVAGSEVYLKWIKDEVKA